MERYRHDVNIILFYLPKMGIELYSNKHPIDRDSVLVRGSTRFVENTYLLNISR